MSSLSIAAVLGFSGVLYELVFAQSLSILFGQSVIQYSLTIGLFLAGMGVGAQLSEWVRDAVRGLWWSQIVLCLGAPVTFILTWWLGVSGWTLLVHAVGYGMCFGVGMITGLELPLLMRWSAESTGRILAADYGGMLIACLAFPLVLLPEVGLFATLLGCATVNGVLALTLRPTPRTMWAPLLSVSLLILEPTLREWLSQRLVAG